MEQYTEQDDVITGVKNEKTICEVHFNNVHILVTKGRIDKNKEQYFNVYFIDPMFRTEPLNNLNEQIPVENEPKDWTQYLQCRYIEYLAWREFGLEGSFNIEE